MKDRAYRVPDQQVASVSIPQGKFIVMNRDMTCLIQYIDKGLRVTAGKATNLVIHVLGREGGLNQGGEFIRDELALEQSSKGWTVAVERDGLGSNQCSMPDRRTQGQFLPLSDTEVIEAL